MTRSPSKQCGWAGNATQACIALLAVALATAFACERSAGVPAEPASQATQLSGRVLEQVDSPPYSFLRLRTDAGEAWVAIPIASVNAQRPVRVTNAVALRDFEIGPGRKVAVVYLGTLQQ